MDGPTYRCNACNTLIEPPYTYHQMSPCKCDPPNYIDVGMPGTYVRVLGNRGDDGLVFVEGPKDPPPEDHDYDEAEEEWVAEEAKELDFRLNSRPPSLVSDPVFKVRYLGGLDNVSYHPGQYVTKVGTSENGQTFTKTGLLLHMRKNRDFYAKGSFEVVGFRMFATTVLTADNYYKQTDGKS